MKQDLQQHLASGSDDDEDEGCEDGDSAHDGGEFFGNRVIRQEKGFHSLRSMQKFFQRLGGLCGDQPLRRLRLCILNSIP